MKGAAGAERSLEGSDSDADVTDHDPDPRRLWHLEWVVEGRWGAHGAGIWRWTQKGRGGGRCKVGFLI